MSNLKIFVFLFLALILLGVVIVISPGAFQPGPKESIIFLSEAEKLAVEEYVRQNISSLSPNPAVLGGRFYVTNISISDHIDPEIPATGRGSGFVEYEDGHISLSARFVFDFDEREQVVVTFFETLDNQNGSAFLKQYASSQADFSFVYPAYYFLEEKSMTTPSFSNTGKILVLTEDTEENRLVREGKAPGREGPVSITIEVYDVGDITTPNVSINEVAERWIKNTNSSNFHMSNGVLTDTVVGGLGAKSYSWSGLYEADSVVVFANNRIYVFTVQFIGLDDQIRTDFYKIIDSVTLSASSI
jgi:hypothetical protein